MTKMKEYAEGLVPINSYFGNNFAFRLARNKSDDNYANSVKWKCARIHLIFPQAVSFPPKTRTSMM